MDVATFAVNQFIPHPMMLFAASTYNENGSPHLALVSWMNFYWDDGLGITLCMDGDKAVKRNFEREGVMVLNALSRDMLDAVEALGRASGREKDEVVARFALEPAKHVHAPQLRESPLRYEISLRKSLSFEGSNLYLCAIDSVSAADAAMQDGNDASYDIVAANPLLASQKNYCCLSAQEILGTWC